MKPELFETTVESRVIETRKGLEALVFEFPFKLGPFSMKIICIANIPEQGMNKAPVYIKFKLGEDDSRPKRHFQPRRHQLPLPEVVRVNGNGG